MMLGPTKKKILITGIVAFVIPVLIFTIVFVNYKKAKDVEIENLRIQGEVIPRYVFARNMLAGEIITSGDIKMVNVKAESAPIDSYSGDFKAIFGRRIKINAEERTMVTTSMLANEVDKNPTIDERLQEFNMFVLPSDLNSGDFIDVRMTMPTGEDYLVISGKEVKEIGRTSESNALFLQLNEEEILRTTAAIIESYMNDGYKIYVNKYVDPSNQLYDYERVDFVKAFEDTMEGLIAERQKLADENLKEYLMMYEPEVWEAHSGEFDGTKINSVVENTIPEQENVGEVVSGDSVSGDLVSEDSASGDSVSGDTLAITEWTVTEDDITDLEIANLIGLSEKQTADIRNALKNKNQEVLNLYNDKLVTTRKDMINTYPVKENIAKVIKQNPNILQTIKDKYNVEQLIKQREELLEFPLYQVNEYGEIEYSEAMNKLQENINKEIEDQRAERKEYLKTLILGGSTSNE